MTDRVLVVGAGPVSLTLACELARAGVDVRLVDRLAEPSPDSKAVGVHARTLELLESLGLAERFARESVHAVGATLLSGDTTIAEVGFERVDSEYRYVACLAQDVTERILTEALREQGADVERAVELIGLEQDSDAVSVTLRGADGAETSDRVAYAAGCDGGHSTVRRLTGSRLEGSFEGESFLLVDCDADHALARDRIYIVFHPDGLFALFPLPGKRVRIAAQLREPLGGEPTLAAARAVTEARVGAAVRLSEPRWVTCFEVRNAQVLSYRVGRVFLAGDAAHVHSPAGGQGMNTGMQDAHNLSWKLALAVSGAAAPGLLDSYHAERHPVGAKVVAGAAALTRLLTASGTVTSALRRALLRVLVGHTPLREKLARELSETAVSYHESPIVGGEARRTVAHGPLRPGDLAPSAGGLTRRFDPTAHTVLLFGSKDAIGPRLQSSFGPRIRLVEIDDAEEDAAARYGAGEGLVAVVRPDRYLAYLGEAGDLEGVERTLALAIG